MKTAFNRNSMHWLIVILVLLATTAVVLAQWQTWRTQNVARRVMRENVEEILAAADLRSALQRQRGYLAAYLLDGGEEQWLRRLEAVEPTLGEFLAHLVRVTDEPGERDIVSRLQTGFRAFDAARDDVLALFASGEAATARERFLNDVEKRYVTVMSLADEIVEANRDDIQNSVNRMHQEGRTVTLFVVSSALLTVLLGVGLSTMLVIHVSRPQHNLHRTNTPYREKRGLDAGVGDGKVFGVWGTCTFGTGRVPSVHGYTGSMSRTPGREDRRQRPQIRLRSRSMVRNAG